METKPRTFQYHPNTSPKKIVVHPVTFTVNFWQPFPGGRCLHTAEHNGLKIVLDAEFYNGPVNIFIYQQ